MKSLTWAACACLLAAPALALAATATVVVTEVPTAKQDTRAYAEMHISKAAIAGEKIRVWFAQMLNPDCTAYGNMETRILQAPPRRGGDLGRQVHRRRLGPANPRYACNTVAAPGKQAFYTAKADFHGHDKVVLQNSTSEGRIRKIVVDIDVH